MGAPTLTPTKWEPYNRYVQTGMVDGNYASGAFTLISAGPPRLGNASALAGALTWPIGMVQNFTLSHNSQFNRIFEIGSERSYFVRGRSTGQMSLGRVLYHGPSILRALYASFSDYNVMDGVGVPHVGFPGDAGMLTASALHPNKHNVKINPGYENLYLNLASDMFSNPIGLMIKTMDSNEQTIGVVYAEGCYIPNHSFSTDSQGLLIQEQVSIQFERLVPVKTSVVQLAGDLLNAAAPLVNASSPTPP
jgi:hypothetical protein